MKITKEDVGRQVVDDWGEVETIIAFNEGEEYPVKTNRDIDYTEAGVFLKSRPDSVANLARFLDEG